MKIWHALSPCGHASYRCSLMHALCTNVAHFLDDRNDIVLFHCIMERTGT